MKKIFTEPEMMTVNFTVEDVVTVSGDTGADAGTGGGLGRED